VTSVHLITLELGCRGAAVGLFLLIMGILLRDRSISTVARLAAALAAGAAAHAICAAPGFQPEREWWPLPLLALSWGSPAVFWLWARATFNDEFTFRPWHLVLWAALAGLGLFVSYGAALWPVATAAINRTLSITALILALSAAAQTLTTWRADLIAGRRRLRIVVLIGALAYIVTVTIAGLSSVSSVSTASPGSVADALGLLILAAFGGWTLFQVADRGQSATLIPVTADATRTTPAADGKAPPIELAALRRLQRLMAVERPYRQEGLTSAVLAGKLGLPEYRLRKLINEGLGHRNFNAFLNHYRIEEARQAFTDPAQKDVPVLTIAMDAGFQSIGPFNRAFKSDTGQTPTEYRRAALARSPSIPSA